MISSNQEAISFDRYYLDFGLVAEAVAENKFERSKLQNINSQFRALEEKDVSSWIFF